MRRVVQQTARKKKVGYYFDERGESEPPVVDYARMDEDGLIDHFIDDGGLAQFIDTQMTGVPRSDWQWQMIARDLMAFSHYLQFSPEYLEELYDMQKERQEKVAVT